MHADSSIGLFISASFVLKTLPVDIGGCVWGRPPKAATIIAILNEHLNALFEPHAAHTTTIAHANA